MKLNDLLGETHHAYTNISYDTKFDPVKDGDTFTVYHGFHSLGDALQVAKHGLSGKTRAPRRYSYEADNNPEGLFVTLSLDVAKEFTGSYHAHVVMEFISDYKDLESPVWPGDGYTVQGQMSQSFGGFGSENRRLRSTRRKELEKDTEAATNSDHVKQSDQKYLASILTNSREYQALFRGHTNPEEISAFWVRPSDGMDPKYDKEDKWVRLNVKDFLNKYDEQSKNFKPEQHYRVFNANDTFDGDEFLKRLGNEYGSIDVDDGIKYLWRRVGREKTPEKRKREFIGAFDNYLWPKQYKDAYRWLGRRYSET